MKKRIALTVLLLSSFAYTQEAPKRVTLTKSQVAYYEQINREIEDLPEVKAKRAIQKAFLDGIASGNGFYTYKAITDGKGGAALEQVADKK